VVRNHRLLGLKTLLKCVSRASRRRNVSRFPHLGVYPRFPGVKRPAPPRLG